VVEIGQREVWEWRHKGHNGDHTLVCWLCHIGTDGQRGSRIVALGTQGP